MSLPGRPIESLTVSTFRERETVVTVNAARVDGWLLFPEGGPVVYVEAQDFVSDFEIAPPADSNQ